MWGNKKEVSRLRSSHLRILQQCSPCILIDFEISLDESHLRSMLSVLFCRALLFVGLVATYVFVWDAAGPKPIAGKPDPEQLETWAVGVVAAIAVLLLARGVRPVLVALFSAVGWAFCSTGAGSFLSEYGLGLPPLEYNSDVVKIVCAGAFLLCFNGPWVRRSKRDAMPRLRLRPMEAEIRNLYLLHNPAKLGSVDNLLLKYRGREEELYEKILERYEGGGGGGGVDTPSPPRSSGRIDMSLDDETEDNRWSGAGEFGGGGGGGGGGFGGGNGLGVVAQAKMSYKDQLQERIRRRLAQEQL